VEQIVRKEPVTFTDFLRKTFKNVLEPVAMFFNRLGIMPNTMTILGLVGNVFGAVLLALGHIPAGGVVILLMGPIDALDGTMARLRGLSSEFGAFVDSVTDRYSELVIFLGLLIYFLREDLWLGVLMVYLAAAGSVLVSYIRARAQSVGFETKIGLFTRVERFLVLVPGLIFNQPIISLALIAFFGNITALQRIWHVRKQAYERTTVKREG